MQMPFWVYWNTKTPSARIRRPECVDCNDGQGKHLGRISSGRGLWYNWERVDSYDEAVAIIRQVPRRADPDQIAILTAADVTLSEEWTPFSLRHRDRTPLDVWQLASADRNDERAVAIAVENRKWTPPVISRGPSSRVTV